MEGPTGIGGWLLLPAIGLVLNVIGVTVGVVDELLPVFTGPTWEELTTEGSESYHPMWGPLLLIELVGNSLLIVASVVVGTFFFLRKAVTPRLMVGLYLFVVVFFLLHQVMASDLPEAASDTEGAAQLVWSFISACLWIPYFLLSRRVENTFVRP